MHDLKQYLLLLFVTLLGSAAGFLLDHHKEISENEPIKFNRLRLITYIVLGLVAGFSVFFILTEARDVRSTDYIWSCLSAMKGAEWLQKAGTAVLKKQP